MNGLVLIVCFDDMVCCKFVVMICVGVMDDLVKGGGMIDFVVGNWFV